MGTAEDSAERRGTLRRRRIIERPRLFALLDDANARIAALIAPAGYGKTTLADQWVAREGRVGAWFRARTSSTDVAALALGLARAATAAVPDCDVRLREHLRALPAPADNLEVLAEILAEDFEHWPTNAWLVIDEYEAIAGAKDAERFVETLIAVSPIQIMVTSRLRPAWATDRSVIYGDVVELGRADLAMDSRETGEVLDQPDGRKTSGLLAIANGWPAVIGLASVAPAEIDRFDQVPESLYRFFAKEVFEAFAPDVQAGVLALAVAPVLDRVLAAELLGAELAEHVCSSALDVGVMVERGGQLELHPLARSFLEERGAYLGSSRDPDRLETCLRHYRDRHDWDAAFELVARHDLTLELEELLLVALDELLGTARLATIEAWCELGADEPAAPVFALARAEIALRSGRFAEAQIQGEVCAAAGSDLTFRALATAGRAAHLASREEEALELYERAAGAANTDAERRDALWGRLICLTDLEHPDAAEALDEFRAGVTQSNPLEVVRSATQTIGYQLKLGALDFTQADRAHELLGTVRDPITRASFQSIYAAALALAARYEDALSVAASLLETARRYRLDFARPYALCAAASAHAGRREWSDAHQCIGEALATARSGQNGYAEHVCSAMNLRIHAQQGAFDAALSLRAVQLPCPVTSGQAELLATRALVLASTSRLAEARALSDRVRGSSLAIEPRVLVLAVDALVGLKSGDSDAQDQVHRFLDAALTTGALDLLVTAYRAAPELLRVLLRDRSRGDEVAVVLLRVGDQDLAAATGHSLSPEDPSSRLTRREREVFEHLRDGLTNRQIAKLLFISELTVKVHVHHILEKFGVHSRTAIAVQARLEGAQATSAIADDTIGDSSLL